MGQINNQEIELKLKVENRDELVGKLEGLGAKFKAKVNQKDILYNSKFYDFGELDHALRLRVESGKDAMSYLTFKGTPSFSEDGHKTRDEYETEVDNPEAVKKILTSIGFFEAVTLNKKRAKYEINNLHVTIDEFEFGTFLELEGDSGEIEKLRALLDLQNTEPVKKMYVDLWEEWKVSQSK